MYSAPALARGFDGAMTGLCWGFQWSMTGLWWGFQWSMTGLWCDCDWNSDGSFDGALALVKMNERYEGEGAMNEGALTGRTPRDTEISRLPIIETRNGFSITPRRDTHRFQYYSHTKVSR